MRLVMTIGCFDLLHAGHVRLFERMRELGDYLVAGVASEAHMWASKRVVPFEPVDARVTSVRRFVDEVFVVDSATIDRDLVNYISSKDWDAFSDKIYVRGDDWPSFPGRRLVETYMRVLLVPYTPGISSTALRARLGAREHGT